MPNMLYNRSHPICGVATNRDGKRHIVVGGGHGGNTAFESLDMETLEWSVEKPFAFSSFTYATTVVPYGRSFLIIGGYFNGEDSKDIYWASNLN